jgi:hypothetical protein
MFRINRAGISSVEFVGLELVLKELKPSDGIFSGTGEGFEASSVESAILVRLYLDLLLASASSFDFGLIAIRFWFGVEVELPEFCDTATESAKLSSCLIVMGIAQQK